MSYLLINKESVGFKNPIMNSPLSGRVYRTSFIVFIVLTSGCFGLLNGSPDAGELQISNQRSTAHQITIQTDAGFNRTLTVRPNSRQTITITDSPGNYTIRATIDGETTVRTEEEYRPGGPGGEKLTGFGLVLRLQPDREPYFSDAAD